MAPAPSARAPARLTSEERASYRLGRRSFERGDDEAALAHLKRLASTRPRFADVQYMLGVLHERSGALDDAARSLELALGINPAYAEARLALASVYEQRGEFERSRALVTAGVREEDETGPDFTTAAKLANLQAALGDAYREAGELRDAIEAYRKSLARCPGFHDVRCRLGAALREAGLPHQALREFGRARRANPELLDAGVQLGLTWYSLGEWARAREEWEEVLRRDPAREDARLYLRLGAPA